MLQVDAFRSESESGSWRTNSSFESPGEGIYGDSRERWQQVLAPAEVDAIHALAGPELALMGYDVPADVGDPAACLSTPCEPDSEELAPWIQPFPCASYLRDPAERVREYALESLRRSVLEGRVDVDSGTEERLFLDRALLSELRECWGR